MPKALVTGCAGFIGSHLCERLLAEGYTVTGIDNFSRFYDRAIKENNLNHFREHERFRFHELDIRDREALFAALTEPADIVFHLAAKAGVRPSIQAPEAYIDTNIHGTNNILEWMRRQQMTKLLFASSSSVYGNQAAIPFREDATMDEPISPYAFTKRACELATHTYHHLYGFDVINARFFTVYGPRQRPDLAIHKFVKLISSGQSIQMFGDGSTARDYTFVADTIDGVMKAAAYLLENNPVYTTVNLGNHTPVKLKALIEGIGEALGIAPQVEQLPMQDGDVDITYADITRAQELFGYDPKTNIRDGLSRFVAWFRKQHQA